MSAVGLGRSTGCGAWDFCEGHGEPAINSEGHGEPAINMNGRMAGKRKTNPE